MTTTMHTGAPSSVPPRKEIEMSDETADAERWTPEQIAEFNRSQYDPRRHPATCGSGKRGDDIHRVFAEEFGHRDTGLLIATPNGPICLACKWMPSRDTASAVETSMHDRIRALESELARIRPVYQAACAFSDEARNNAGAAADEYEALDVLHAEVDRARKSVSDESFRRPPFGARP